MITSTPNYYTNTR